MQVEIKTIDCPVISHDGSSVLNADGKPQVMRCVREIARSDVGDAVRWQMITWNVGQIGATFQPCASLAEAVAVINSPPTPIRSL